MISTREEQRQDSTQVSHSNRLSEIERHMNRQEREINHLASKNERMVTQIRSLQNERTTFEATVKALQSDLTGKSALVESLQQQLHATAEECRSVQTLNSQLRIESLNSDKEEERQRLRLDLERSKQTEELNSLEIKRLVSENEQIRGNVSALQKQLRENGQQQQQQQQSSQISMSGTASIHEQVELQRIRVQLQQRQRDCEELSKCFAAAKASMVDQMKSLQQSIAQKDLELHKKSVVQLNFVKEIEILKENLQVKAEEIEQYQAEAQIAVEQNDAKLQLKQSEIAEKETQISQLNSEIDRLTRANRLLEDTWIPTEADSIKEISMKYAEAQKESADLANKNAILTQQLEYVKDDLKKKLPQLNLRKADYESMYANFSAMQHKLSLAEKSMSQLVQDKQILHDYIDDLLSQKDQEEKVLQSVEEHNLYLSFLFDRLKKIVVANSAFIGVNLLAFNTEYVKTAGFSDQSVKDEFDKYRLAQSESILLKSNHIRQQQRAVVTMPEYTNLKEKSQCQDSEISRLNDQVKQLNGKIDELEKRNTIRKSVLTEESKMNSIADEADVSRLKQRLSATVAGKEEARKEVNKLSLEVIRLRSELIILEDVNTQTQRLADLYAKKYEQILESQLKENMITQQERMQAVSLKQQVKDLSVANAAAIEENQRLSALIDQLSLQIKAETQLYHEAVRNKKLYADRDHKASSELQQLRMKVQEQMSCIAGMTHSHSIELQAAKQKQAEMRLDFSHKLISQSVQLENYRLVQQQSKDKLRVLNKIILDQESQIKQLRSNASYGFDEDIDNVEDSEVVGEQLLRLDTQFLKNLNKMEQVVKQQRQEHTESVKTIQDTMQGLAEACIRLSEKLKQAETAETNSTAQIAQLEANYLAELDKKEADYQLMQREKEQQIEGLESRFKDYRAEQALVQEDIRKKFEQEQTIMSQNDESSFKLKRLTDEKQELENQLTEIKTYLAEIATERLVIEAAQQVEIRLYVAQINAKKTVMLRQIADDNSEQQVGVVSAGVTTAAAANNHLNGQSSGEMEIEEESVLKVINDRDTQAQYQAKIVQLQEQEETLRRENAELAKMNLTLEEELAVVRTNQMAEKELIAVEEIDNKQQHRLDSAEAEVTLLKQEKLTLLSQVAHLSRINASMSIEDAANINELVTNEKYDQVGGSTYSKPSSVWGGTQANTSSSSHYRQQSDRNTSNRSNGNDDRSKVCFNCNQEGHQRRYCPNGSSSNNSNSNNNLGYRGGGGGGSQRGGIGGGSAGRRQQGRNDRGRSSNTEKSLHDRDPNERYEFIENCPQPDDEDWGGGGGGGGGDDDDRDSDEEERRRKKKEKKKLKKQDSEMFDDDATAQTVSITTTSANHKHSFEPTFSAPPITNENNDDDDDWGGTDDNDGTILPFSSTTPISNQGSEHSSLRHSTERSANMNIHDPRSSFYQKDAPVLRQNSSRERERSYDNRENHDRKSSEPAYQKNETNKYQDSWDTPQPSSSQSNHTKINNSKSSSSSRNSNNNGNRNNSNDRLQKATEPKKSVFQPDHSWNLPFVASPAKENAAKQADNFYSSWDDDGEEQQPKKATESIHNNVWDNWDTPVVETSKTPTTTTENKQPKVFQSSWDDNTPHHARNQDNNANYTASKAPEKNTWTSSWDDNQDNEKPTNYSSQHQFIMPVQQPPRNLFTKQQSNQKPKHHDIVILDSDDDDDNDTAQQHTRRENELTNVSQKPFNLFSVKKEEGLPSKQQPLATNSTSNNDHAGSSVYEPTLKEQLSDKSAHKLSLLINPDSYDTSNNNDNNNTVAQTSKLSIENIFDFDYEEKNQVEEETVKQEFESIRFADSVKMYSGIPPLAKTSIYYNERQLFESQLQECLYPHTTNKGSCYNVYYGPIRMRKSNSKVLESQEIKVKMYSNHKWDDIKWIPSLKQSVSTRHIKEFKTIDFMIAHNVFKQMRPRENYDRIFFLYWLEGINAEEDLKLEDYANFLFSNNVVAGINLENFCFTLAHIEQIFPSVQQFKRPGVTSPIKLVVIANPEIQYQVYYKQVPYLV